MGGCPYERVDVIFGAPDTSYLCYNSPDGLVSGIYTDYGAMVVVRFGVTASFEGLVTLRDIIFRWGDNVGSLIFEYESVVIPFCQLGGSKCKGGWILEYKSLVGCLPDRVY